MGKCYSIRLFPSRSLSSIVRTPRRFSLLVGLYKMRCLLLSIWDSRCVLKTAIWKGIRVFARFLLLHCRSHFGVCVTFRCSLVYIKQAICCSGCIRLACCRYCLTSSVGKSSSIRSFFSRPLLCTLRSRRHLPLLNGLYKISHLLLCSHPRACCRHFPISSVMEVVEHTPFFFWIYFVGDSVAASLSALC